MQCNVIKPKQLKYYYDNVIHRLQGHGYDSIVDVTIYVCRPAADSPAAAATDEDEDTESSRASAIFTTQLLLTPAPSLSTNTGLC